MSVHCLPSKPGIAMPLNEFAAMHGVGRSTVRRWIATGRIPAEKRGGGEIRAGVVLILTDDRPEPLARHALSPEQRAGWKKW